jgi:cyclophilin family peptidyl-prolyl cis-trans isomerase
MVRMQMLTVLAVAAAVMMLAGCGAEKKPYAGPALPYTPEPLKPKEPNPTALISTTLGDINIELFEDDAPNTVANFIELAEKKFYDGLIFHRVIKDFMIQGGDPQGTGAGGPGYKFPDEVKNNPQKLEKYTLAMANSGANTNGSQFFIMNTDREQPQLQDPRTGQSKHTIFGKVTSGQAVVDKITDVPLNGSTPREPVKMTSVKILTKRSHKYEVQRKTPDLTMPPPPPAAGTTTPAGAVGTTAPAGAAGTTAK